MRKGLVCAVALIWTTATGWAQGSNSQKPQPPETLVKWHFRGTEQLADVKNLRAFQNILALPETAGLGKAAAESFTRKALARFAQDVPTNRLPQLRELISPLIEDLPRYETRFEMAAVGAKDADWILALQLPEERAAEWNKNLSTLVKSTGMRFATPRDNPNAWSGDRDGYRISFSREKNWVVLEGGYASGENAARAFKNFRSSLGKRRGELLTADLNLPQLADLWSAKRLAHAPRIQLAVTPKDDGVRSEMTMEYPEALGIKPEKWNPPADAVREPIIGFTAVQGVRGKLAKSERIKRLNPDKIPNQLFTWSQSSTPFSLYAAADVGNPVEMIDTFLSTELPRLQEEGFSPGGRLVYVTNRHALMLRGLPIIIPHVQPAPEPHSSFLLAGLFPVQELGGTNRAPAELFSQLQTKNLVYYEWEITQERLKQWRPLWQLRHILSGKTLPVSDAASQQWLEAAAPLLGNCVTEVTLDSPKRLKATRQSQIGFNAFELLLFAHWLDPDDVTKAPVTKSGEKVPAAPILP